MSPRVVAIRGDGSPGLKSNPDILDAELSHSSVDDDLKIGVTDDSLFCKAEAKLVSELHSMVSGFEKDVGEVLRKLLRQVNTQREKCCALVAENGRLRELLGAAASRQEATIAAETESVLAEAESTSVDPLSVAPNIVVKLYEESAVSPSPVGSPARSPRSQSACSSGRDQELVSLPPEHGPPPGPTLLCNHSVGFAKPLARPSALCSEPETATGDEAGDGKIALVEYELLPFWQELTKVQRSSTTRGRISRWSARDRPTLNRYTTTWTTRRLESMLVQNPVSFGRMFWETMGTVFAIYDLLIMPMQVFDAMRSIVDNGPFRLFAVVQVLYWTLDVPASFFVAYYVDGVLETRLKLMMLHYFRSWFFPDVVLIICDWAIIVLDNQSNGNSTNIRHMKVARALRLLRNFRLLRLLKLQSFQRKLKEHIRSEYILTMMHIGKLVVFIVVVNHFVACAWYYVGSHNSKSWTSMFLQTDTISYRYSTSLHWSLTQFTPASMEVHPTNTQERVFNVFVLIAALVTFGSFISSITEAMNRLRQINGRMNSQRSALRRYISENKVSAELSMRVWKFLGQCKQARPRRLMLVDVELVAELPPMLQAEMHFEVFARGLFWHPFFHHYGDRAPAAMQAVCHKTVTEVALITGQGLFSTDQASDRFYFVVEGTLSYTLDVSLSFSLIDLPNFVNSGQWLSEAALWVRWYHTGSSSAVTVAMLLSVEASKLHVIMREYVDTVWSCRRYATFFAAHASGEGRRTPMTDVCDDFDAVQAMAQMSFEEEDLETPGSMASVNGNMVSDAQGPGGPGGGILRLAMRRFSTSSTNSNSRAIIGRRS